MILTLKEYDKLLQEKARAEQEARNTKYDAERAIDKAKRDASYTAQKAAEEARQTVADMEEALAMTKTFQMDRYQILEALTNSCGPDF